MVVYTALVAYQQTFIIKVCDVGDKNVTEVQTDIQRLTLHIKYLIAQPNINTFCFAN